MFTLNTKSAVAPAVVMSVGNVHVTTPPDSSQKEVESASSNVRPLGTLSVTTTFVASAGPELFICNVYRTSSPNSRFVGDCNIFVIVTSVH